MSRKYYTLACRDDGKWSPQFGDYNRAVVAGEYSEYAESVHGYSRKDMKIITSGDSQAEINAAVAELNK